MTALCSPVLFVYTSLFILTPILIPCGHLTTRGQMRGQTVELLARRVKDIQIILATVAVLHASCVDHCITTQYNIHVHNESIAAGTQYFIFSYKFMNES